MSAYYFQLAVRSLRANVALTVLIIAAVAVGIGATMTVFTVLLAMSGDPIPAKSSQLFAPQIDVWGPSSRKNDSSNQEESTWMKHISAERCAEAHTTDSYLPPEQKATPTSEEHDG